MREIIKYTSENCGPCKLMTPLVEQLCAKEDIKLTSITMDLENAVDGVTTIPTLILKEDGVEVNRVVGLTPPPTILEAFNV